MKLLGLLHPDVKDHVAPLAGAWIETCMNKFYERGDLVAPLAGAWIETSPGTSKASPPPVAPLAGAWIETYPARVAGG